MLKGERWKPIKGFEEGYKVSNYGKVLSVERLQCKHCGHQGKKKRYLACPAVGNSGYRMCSLVRPGMGAHKSKTFTVHRLVAEHFVEGQTEENCVVNHIDGNKLNNNAVNLEWVSQSENNKHAIRIGLISRWKNQFGTGPLQTPHA